jgi:signal transduction histidine kinase/tetratricopeptide (TPR) repeat protein
MEQTLGHYENTALLKAGQGITTLLATDRIDGATVVIKRAPASDVSPSTQARLQHDAGVLQRLKSEQIAPAIELVREGDELCLISPYIAGTTLAKRLERGPLPLDEALSIARDLFHALAEAHESGVFHREVKPANVVIGEATGSESAGGARPGAQPGATSSPTGRGKVTLIDFGLSRSRILSTSSVHGVPAETALYVSPEQAGLIDADVGERSDLYSAGVVLFECIAGHVPFRGETVGEVLRRHLSAPVPSLRGLGLHVPASLDAIVRRLLQKDPRDRYQSAAGVLADLDALRAALARGERDPAIVIGAHDRRRTLTEPSLVGRDVELAGFGADLDVVRSGGARLVLLEGESGGGKTRLLDELAVRASQRGAWVLRGQASASGVRRPLELFDALARRIVADAKTDGAIAPRLRAALGERIDAACEALPSLDPVLRAEGASRRAGPAAPDEVGVPGTSGAAREGAEEHREARTLPALGALLGALGTAERDAVLLLDDCQWADELSIRLVASWFERRAGGHMLVVVAFRDEDVGALHPLRLLAPSRMVVLPKLAPSHVRALALSMAGALPPSVLATVERVADANPLFAVSALEGLVEGGALVPTARGWEIDEAALAAATASRRGATLLHERLGRLGRGVRAVLSVGAVLGRSFDLALAADLADRPASETHAALLEARRRHFVWVDASGATYSFAHDRIRESLLAQLPPDERKRLHRLAAARLTTRLDAEGRQSLAYDVAYHFDAAGDFASALPYALRAADGARARGALETAELQYRIAERGLVGAPPEVERAVAEGLGDVLLLRGRYDEAEEQLERARASASTELDRATLEGKLGELAFKRGRPEEAGRAIERALATLGLTVPSKRWFLVAALYQACVQLILGALPRRLVERGRASDATRATNATQVTRVTRELLAIRLYSRLAYAYWFCRGQAATFWAHLRELNLAERHPGTSELAQACSEHAIGMTGVPRTYFFRRGLAFAERGLAIRRALGERMGEGKSLNALGMLLYSDARYAAALERFREARRLLRRSGDRWEEGIAGVHVALCLYRLGALDEAVEVCEHTHREGKEIGDAHATGIVLEVWAKATFGRVPAALVVEALATSRTDPQTRESVLQAEGVRLLGEGRPAAAAAAFAEAEAHVVGARIENAYVDYVALWRGHALRRAAELAGGPLVVPPGRLPEAERAIRRGLRAARRYRGDRPMALRELALLLARRGALRRALRAIDRSVALAAEQGARVELETSRWVRGAIRAAREDPGGNAERLAAEAALRELGAEAWLDDRPRGRGTEPPAEVTLSLADRFASIVDIGRQIVAANAPEEVYRVVQQAAATLLRGESCAVVMLDGGELRAAVGAMPSERGAFSRSMVRRAFAGRAVVVRSAAPPTDDDSETLTRLRSALAAPILVRGAPVACLCVNHASIFGLFGDDELRLAEYIVALASASLERAAAFAEVQAFSRSLEGRVAERTAQLRAANEELDRNLVALRETQEQLMQTGKLAAVGTLVAGLSHEINNPLAVILANAQRELRRLDPGNATRPSMEAIERQARRCAALVRTLLDFVRKGSGDRRVVRAQALVEEVIALARSTARRDDVDLALEVAHDAAPPLRVCSTEIESALLNLVNNAVDASPRGGTVSLRLASQERDGREGVLFEIGDHGPGIPEETLVRIFDPFFTTKAQGEGTGLGLSLARKFVETNGGALDVVTHVGQGTKMRVWIPGAELRAGAEGGAGGAP